MSSATGGVLLMLIVHSGFPVSIECVKRNMATESGYSPDTGDVLGHAGMNLGFKNLTLRMFFLCVLVQ